MSDGDLTLGVFKHEAFFNLLEGKKEVRRGPKTQSLGKSLPGRSTGKVSHEKHSARLSQEQRASKLLRVLAGAPEVMVKVTGRDKSSQQTKAHLAYLARDEGAQAELPDGEIVRGRGAIKQIAELMDDGLEDGERDHSLAVHVMFSMPAGTATGEQVLAATRAAAKKMFAGHEYALVLHEDKGHKHVHAVVAASGRRGRLRHYKPQLQQWRETFAGELRALGIQAEATPRVIRGVIQKSVSRSVLAIRDEHARSLKSGGKPRLAPIVDQAKVHLAKAMAAGEARAEPGPWVEAVKRNRGVVESAWAQFRKDLESLPKTGAEGARLVDSFLKEMPAVEFERDRILAAVREHKAVSVEAPVVPTMVDRGRSR